MPSSTAWSASVTGREVGLAHHVQVERLEPGHGQRVGVVGQHVREPQVVGVVGGHAGDGHGPQAIRQCPCSSVLAMEINGLPLHPLVVHAAVVFGPLAALPRLAYAVVPRGAGCCAGRCVALAARRRRSRRSSPYLAGERLPRRRGPSSSRSSQDARGPRATLLRTWSLAFVVDALLGAWALGGPSGLASGAVRQDVAARRRLVAMVLLVARRRSALLVLVFLTGDAGAQAVWG